MSSPFKTCHSCQAEIPFCEKRCPYCDQPQLTEFEVRLNGLVTSVLPKRYPASILLLASIIIYFIIMTIDVLAQPGLGLREAFMAPPSDIAFKWGAHRQGNFVWWRLITANFIHFGILHIFFNGMALRYVVPYVERTFGAALTLVSFVVLGGASMACSNILGSGAVVAGASGALMGCIGMAAVAAHREHTALSLEVRNSMIKWAAFTMIFGIVMTVSGAMGIDNIAHASGLILGIIAGFVLPVQSTTGFTRISVIRIARILAVCAFLTCAGAFTAMGMASSSLKYQRECESSMHLKNFEKAEIACANAYRKDKTRMVSYRNYIVISVIRGKNERAAALCAEGRVRFQSQDEQPDFDKLCKSIGVPCFCVDAGGQRPPRGYLQSKYAAPPAAICKANTPPYLAV